MLPADYQRIDKKIQKWLEIAPTPLVEEIIELKQNHQNELIERFCADLSFGTSGFRAQLGAGTAFINVLTIAKVAKSLAIYLKEKNKEFLRCVICFDNRKDSLLLARTAGEFLRAENIEVVLCPQMRPTPFLSFCVQALHAHAGVMITASHNIDSYSGCKIFNRRGSEIPPQEEIYITQILQTIDECNLWQTRTLKKTDIKELDIDLMDQKYCQAISALMLHRRNNEKNGSCLRIVYSALFGTGVTLATRALASWGFTNVILVDDQCTPGEVFHDIAAPNPEDMAVYERGLSLAVKHGAELVFVNDCDADRVGVASIDNGVAYVFSGNEIVTLLLYHRCCIKKMRSELQDDSFVISSFVTTPILKAIAEHFSIEHFVVPTGFKYIGIFLHAMRNKDLIMAAEESYGCLLGSYANDKDGIAAMCALAELALYLKADRKTLKQFLYEIYAKFGVYREKHSFLLFPDTLEGKRAIAEVMEKARKSAWQTICNKKIVTIIDYAEKKEGIACDALQFILDDDTSVLLRPSGTEPKLRIHVSMKELCVDIDKTIISLDNKIPLFIEQVKMRLV